MGSSDTTEATLAAVAAAAVTFLVMFIETVIVIVPLGIQLLIQKMKKIRRRTVVTLHNT